MRAARDIAGRHGLLIAAVNSDEFMIHYKREPRRPEAQRIQDVVETGIADDVILWNGPAGQDAQILSVKPDLYVAGTDWLGKDLAVQLDLPSLSWFDEQRISLLYLRRTQGISTTDMIEMDRGT